jgi:hypothetical protein
MVSDGKCFDSRRNHKGMTIWAAYSNFEEKKKR